MTDLEVQRNNPLHGVKLEVLLTELVEHYGFEVLADSLKMNCFKSNPSIKSSLKFLRKTDWAREKVEAFYLYKYKSLPRPDDKQYALPPRERIIPLDHKPSKPISINVAKPAYRKRDEQSASSAESKKPSIDVWAKWRSKDDASDSK